MEREAETEVSEVLRWDRAWSFCTKPRFIVGVSPKKHPLCYTQNISLCPQTPDVVTYGTVFVLELD